MRASPKAAALVALVALAGIAGPLAVVSNAAAQAPRPVGMTARALFGEDMLLPNAHVPILVTLQNRTDQTLSGRVIVAAESYVAGRGRYEIAADLPARESRQVVLTPYVPEGTTVKVTFRVAGRDLSETSVTTAYSPATSGIVLLDDPSHLRGALLEMEVEEPAVGPYGSPRMVRTPVGTVPVDARSADAILPRSPVGWSAVSLFVASAPAFERIAPPERDALIAWVRAGGELLVFLRSESDLRGAALSALLGAVEVRDLPPNEDGAAFVPGDGRPRQLVGEGVRSELFGGSRRVGFGRVWVATYEGTSARLAASPQTRALVGAILTRPPRAGGAPILPFARYEDTVGDTFGQGPNFGALRPALDPNEGYRPALALVAVVLLFYVILVGPLNFMFIGRRGTPTLALVTTPIAALGCLLVLLAVGYLGKGTRMRYRSVELVEALEGDSSGPARRYSGLFLTRPASFEMASPAHGVARQIGSGGDPSISEDDGAVTTLRGMQGGLWETVFVREDRMAELGGEVTFERSGRRIEAVQNGTRRDLRGAIIIDGVGGVYVVGDLPAGGRGAVSSTSAMTISQMYGPDEYAVQQLAGLMGFDQDRKEILYGISSAFGGGLTSAGIPVLLAFSEVERGEVADTFGPEFDYSFLRVVPDLERGEVTR